MNDRLEQLEKRVTKLEANERARLPSIRDALHSLTLDMIEAVKPAAPFMAFAVVGLGFALLNLLIKKLAN